MAARLKAHRRRLIVRLLSDRAVTSQTQLASLLRARGTPVTQATLSRDLEEIGAYKARLADGRVAYRLPDEPPVDGEHLQRMLSEFVIQIDSSGQLAVLRTPPGCAQPVARALDAAPPKEVLATVAGDDTVLVVCREGSTGRAVARRLASLGAAAGRKGA